MAISFSRSMRSIQADTGAMTLIGLVAAALLLLLWTGWFFLAPIGRYETGSILRTTGDGLVLAEFPTQALEHIHPGQAAWVRLQDTSAQASSPIAAIVFDVPAPNESTSPIVQLYVTLDETNVALLQAGLSGQVEIEVEQVSPATLALRATDHWIGTAPLSVNPSPR